MKRRRLLGGAAASLTLLATGCTTQPTPTRVVRIGAVSGESHMDDGSPPRVELDVMEGLHAAGFIDGVNMSIEWLHTEGDPKRFTEIVKSFVDDHVDLIVASSGSAIRAAKQATSTIPIVMAGMPDPDEEGIIQSYQHPGGNITGMAFSNGDELRKRIELFHEAFPRKTRLLVICVPDIDGEREQRIAQAQAVGRTFNMDVDTPLLTTGDEIARALAAMTADEGIVLLGYTLTWANTPKIIKFASVRKTPVVYSRLDDVKSGGLMSYGSSRHELRVGVGAYVRKIVDGARPGDLPVGGPTLYDLGVNQQTAVAAGFALPASVLGKATTVIE